MTIINDPEEVEKDALLGMVDLTGRWVLEVGCGAVASREQAGGKYIFGFGGKFSRRNIPPGIKKIIR